ARLDQIENDERLELDLLERLRVQHRERLRRVDHRGHADGEHRTAQDLHDKIEFSLIEAERQRVNELYRRGELKDEARRRIEREIDLREAQLVSWRGEER
ncbi:MAG TPA: Na+/H+ antiporter, partial [Gammaproteobacteria bacterium]|nr:Na+/H+ antiporter [Gammaproteobacteria bacterium]